MLFRGMSLFVLPWENPKQYLNSSGDMVYPLRESGLYSKIIMKEK